MDTIRNINKTTLLLILGVIIVIIIFIFLFVFSFFSSQKPATPKSSIPTPYPSSSALPTPRSQEEELQRQTEADLNVNNIQNDILTKYPWYNSLPIQETNYFVYFDVPQKSFIGLLYPRSSLPTSQEEQINNYKAEAILKLQQIGVNTNDYPILWEINPR